MLFMSACYAVPYIKRDASLRAFLCVEDSKEFEVVKKASCTRERGIWLVSPMLRVRLRVQMTCNPMRDTASGRLPWHPWMYVVTEPGVLRPLTTKQLPAGADGCCAELKKQIDTLQKSLERSVTQAEALFKQAATYSTAVSQLTVRARLSLRSSLNIGARARMTS